MKLTKSRRAIGKLVLLVAKCVFKVLSVGPIPNHVAFIMDGNRRFAKKLNSGAEFGHRAGFSTMVVLLIYCLELGVRHFTVYAFSIDNFKRNPEEVRCLMALILEKIEALMDPESVVNKLKIRVRFAGDLELLSGPIRLAAERLTRATADHRAMVLSVCLAYTSRDEIVNAVQRACEEKKKKSLVERESTRGLNLADIERRMYMSASPDPDVIIRSSGEKRLSNFLQWQSSYCQLYSPAALWPELGLWDLVWAVVDYQRSYGYFEDKKKKDYIMSEFDD